MNVNLDSFLVCQVQTGQQLAQIGEKCAAMGSILDRKKICGKYMLNAEKPDITDARLETS